MDMDVLWVHWLEIDWEHQVGWKAKWLYRVQFVPCHEEGTFGFLDPTDVIRSVHLIPGFNNSHFVPSSEGSVSKWDNAPANSWKNYYVNQWVVSSFCQVPHGHTLTVLPGVTNILQPESGRAARGERTSRVWQVG